MYKINDSQYRQKYLKYKQKYLTQKGGVSDLELNFLSEIFNRVNCSGVLFRNTIAKLTDNLSKNFESHNYM